MKEQCHSLIIVWLRVFLRCCWDNTINTKKIIITQISTFFQHPDQVPGPKSTAYPYIDFQKPSVIHMDIHDFWLLVFNSPYKWGYPHWYSSRDIHERTFYNGCPWNMNIHELISVFLCISVFNYSCFNWYPFGYPLISMDIHTWTCYGFSMPGCEITLHRLITVRSCRENFKRVSNAEREVEEDRFSSRGAILTTSFRDRLSPLRFPSRHWTTRSSLTRKSFPGKT